MELSLVRIDLLQVCGASLSRRRQTLHIHALVCSQARTLSQVGTTSPGTLTLVPSSSGKADRVRV